MSASYLQWGGARLGSDWQVLRDLLTVRAGGSYESPSSRPSYTSLDFIGQKRLGASAGVTLSGVGFDLSVAYSYVFQFPVAVSEAQSRIYQQVPGSPCAAPYSSAYLCDPHYLGQPSAASNAGTYVSEYHFISTALSYTFY